MGNGTHENTVANQPPQALQLPVIPAAQPAPLPTLPRMFARIAPLCEFDQAQVEHLATFNTARALITLRQGAIEERRALGHLMPDLYAQAVELVGAGHITATIEQEGREPFSFAFATQEQADDDADDQAQAAPLAPAPVAPGGQLDALALLLAEIRADRKAAEEREERREREREIERREEAARLAAQKPALDPFTETLRQKAQELQIKALEKASRALDEATAPNKDGDELDRAVSVIERLANVKSRADDAMARIASTPVEALKEPDMVDMFERVSANPLAVAVAKKFFKIDEPAAPAQAPAAHLPAPAAPGPEAPPVNDVPNPFEPAAPGAAANG